MGLICIRNYLKISSIWIPLWSLLWTRIHWYLKHMLIKLKDISRKIMRKDILLCISLHRYFPEIRGKLHSLLELWILWCHMPKYQIFIQCLTSLWGFQIIQSVTGSLKGLDFGILASIPKEKILELLPKHFGKAKVKFKLALSMFPLTNSILLPTRVFGLILKQECFKLKGIAKIKYNALIPSPIS